MFGYAMAPFAEDPASMPCPNESNLIRTVIESRSMRSCILNRDLTTIYVKNVNVQYPDVQCALSLCKQHSTSLSAIMCVTASPELVTASI